MPSTKIQIAVLLLLVSACDDGATTGAPAGATPNAGTPSAAARPGTVAGKVTDTRGNPITGADIRILGDSLTGQDVAVFPKTAADGTYSAEVADGNYTVSGEYLLDFNGARFGFPLHPKDGVADATFASKNGIVRDFEWRLTGLRPGADPKSTQGFDYYGGEVVSDVVDLGNDCSICNTFEKETPSGFTAEVTFAPKGPLADGTTGETIVSKYEVKSKTGRFWSQLDIPLGRYTVTARLTKPGGEARTMKITKVSFVEDTSNDAPQDEAVLDFLPSNDGSRRPRRMGVHLLYGAPYPAP